MILCDLKLSLPYIIPPFDGHNAIHVMDLTALIYGAQILSL